MQRSGSTPVPTPTLKSGGEARACWKDTAKWRQRKQKVTDITCEGRRGGSRVPWSDEINGFFRKRREAAGEKKRITQRETRKINVHNTTSRMLESPENGGGIVGRNNRLSFSETMVGPLIELVASDSNCASLCCVRRRAVCPCDKPPVRGLVRQ